MTCVLGGKYNTCCLDAGISNGVLSDVLAISGALGNNRSASFSTARTADILSEIDGKGTT